MLGDKESHAQQNGGFSQVVFVSGHCDVLEKDGGRTRLVSPQVSADRQVGETCVCIDACACARSQLHTWG
jgi:hypothetical protein